MTKVHTSDNELINKLQDGDMKAFDQIFKRYGDRIYGFALSYLKSTEEAEEITQDVFLKIWENRSKLKNESGLKSYIFTIAYHDMCKLFRKKEIHAKFLDETSNQHSASANLEEQLEYKATLEEIDRLIGKLPEKQKQIFLKSRKEGKSTREISEEMKLAPGTVDNHISDALKFLRKHISDNNFSLLLFFSIFIQ